MTKHQNSDTAQAASPRKSSSQSGFSLVEIVVVMLIMTVLAGVVAPVASKIRDREARKATTAEMQNVDEAVRLYFLDTGALPANADAMTTDPGSVTGWSGPYLSGGVGNGSSSSTDFGMDGWGVPYSISVAGDVWTLTSAGPDRVQGTTDDLELDVDVTRERRELTDERLAVINLAIRLYNDDWLSPAPPTSPDPLSDTWSTAFGQLVGRGYLANSSTFLTDGWGDSFVRVGSSGPVVSVTSPNTGS
jgi:type II secretion system protein G